jgi:hypothetical protein
LLECSHGLDVLAAVAMFLKTAKDMSVHAIDGAFELGLVIGPIVVGNLIAVVLGGCISVVVVVVVSVPSAVVRVVVAVTSSVEMSIGTRVALIAVVIVLTTVVSGGIIPVCLSSRES